MSLEIFNDGIVLCYVIEHEKQVNDFILSIILFEGKTYLNCCISFQLDEDHKIHDE